MILMNRMIFNWQQAYFYMENGVMPKERPQIHKKTGKIFFVFNDTETQQLYDKWCTRVR